MDLYSFLGPLKQKIDELLELVNAAILAGEKPEARKPFKEVALFNDARKDVLICMTKQFGEKMLSEETKGVLKLLGCDLGEIPVEASADENMAKTAEEGKVSLRSLLSFLRAIAHLYQHMHWHSAGTNYYGDHILYERLYNGALGEIDTVAEKAIGVANDDSVLNPIEDCKHTSAIVEKLAGGEFNVEGFSEIGIAAEKELLEVIAGMMKDGQTDGVENMLQGIADKHEEHLYLLQQRNKSASTLSMQLVKVANRLDKAGKYSEAEKIDSMIKSLCDRVGLNISGDLAVMADSLDSAGLTDEASLIDEALTLAIEK